MARKTTQALKVSATIDLNDDARQGIVDYVIPKSHALSVATGRIRGAKAFAARHDDPVYQARVTERIADLKADLSQLGQIVAWHVTAGAVPSEEVEVLPEVDAGVTDQRPGMLEQARSRLRGHTAETAAAEEIPGHKSKRPEAVE